MPLALASAISCAVGAGTAATTFFFSLVVFVVVVFSVVVVAGVCAKVKVANAANARAVINFFMEISSPGMLLGQGPPTGRVQSVPVWYFARLATPCHSPKQAMNSP